MLKRLLLAAFLVFAVAMAPQSWQRGYAHAVLERSLPPAGAVLEQAPGQVQLWFTEQPELRFSELQVVDALGNRMDAGGTITAENNSSSLIVRLRPGIPNGTYTIVWRVLSAVDGHTTRGTVPFAIGVETVAPEPVQQPPTPGYGAWQLAETFARWAMLLGLAVALGAPAFAVAVWRGAARSSGTPSTARHISQAVPAQLAQLAMAGVATAMAASAALLFVQAARIEGPFGAALGSLLWGTRIGYAWWARLALLATCGLLLLRWSRGPRLVSAPLAPIPFVLGALLTVSLVGHSPTAFTLAPAAVLSDWLHMGAVGAWGGALPALLVAARAVGRDLTGSERTRTVLHLLSRFSDLALLCVGAIAVTGAFMAYVHVGSPQEALTTGYGRALAIKTVLFVGVLTLAGYNLLVLKPRLTATGNTSPSVVRRLAFALAGEVLLVAGILLLSGFMTNTNPARMSLSSADDGRSLTVVRASGSLDLRLRVDALPGFQHRVTVTARDAGGPVTDVDLATLRVLYISRDVGATEVALRRQSPVTFSAEGLLLPLAGQWQLQLLPLRAEPNAAPERFSLTVVASGLVYPAFEPAPPVSGLAAWWPLALAGALGMTAVAGVVVGALLPKRRRRWTVGVVLACSLCGMVAAGILVGQLRGAAVDREAPLVNPIPPSQQSLTHGRALFQQDCVACHGETGKGDGPQAATLSPRPADLTVHIPLHSDRQLYVWMRDGLPGTAMPAFGGKLQEEELWHLLNYLKSQALPATK
jgi:copper transport protein